VGFRPLDRSGAENIGPVKRSLNVDPPSAVAGSAFQNTGVASGTGRIGEVPKSAVELTIYS